MSDFIMIEALPCALIILTLIWKIEMNWRKRRKVRMARSNYENSKSKLNTLYDTGLRTSNKGLRKAYRRLENADQIYAKALQDAL